MMRRFVFAQLALLGFLCGGSPVIAQHRPSAPTDDAVDALGPWNNLHVESATRAGRGLLLPLTDWRESAREIRRPRLASRVPLLPRDGVDAWGDPRDHRWEGFAFGAGALGAMIGMLVHSMCAESGANRTCLTSTLGATVMGGTAGGVVGGLIGSTVPKTVR